MSDGNADFDLDDLDGVENDGADGANSKNFAELRKYARRMEREAKAAAAELEELRTFKATAETAAKENSLEAAFKEAQVDPKYAKLFTAANPDAEPTVDAVKAFAAEYQFPTVAGEEVVATEPEADGLKPIVSGASGAGPASGSKISAQEWLDLQRTDLPRAKAMHEKGLVDFGTVSGAPGLYHDIQPQ